MAAPSSTTKTEAPTSAPVLTGATAEIPFVPSFQRQARQSSPVDDTIVQVGQARPRNRKRSQKGASNGSQNTAKVTVKNEDIVPFDYATAPNILDDEPVEEEKKMLRKRQKKGKGPPSSLVQAVFCVLIGFSVGGGALERDDFPRAPRDRTQVKSGNMSHTFR